MNQCLSQEGIQELNSRLESEESEAAKAAGRPARRIKLYDFKRPDKFSKDQIQTVQNMHETFARLATTALSATTRSLAQVRVASVDQLTYEEFIHSIPVPTTLGIFAMEPLKGQALLEMDPAVAFAIVDRLFGGAGSYFDPGRELTDIEHSILEDILVRILGSLRESWTPVLDIKPRLAQIETFPQFAQIVPPSEMLILVSLATRIGEVEGMMNLCLPYITIEPIVPRLSAQYWYSSALPPRDERIDRRLLGHISGLEVEAEIYREGDALSLRDLGRLREGSLVPMPAYERGEAFLSMGDAGLLRLKAQGGSMAKPAAYAVVGMTKGEDIPELESASPATEGSEARVAIKSALADFASSLDAKLSGIKQGLSELQRKQDRIADQLAFGQAGEDSGEPLEHCERTRPFDFARRSDPALLLGFIQGEHPQTIALILSYLEPQAASLVLAGLSPALQPEVVKRIATLGRVMPEVLREIERVLDKELSVASSEAPSLAGGLDGTIDILNLAARSVERNVIEAMERSDPELAEELKKRMFVFEDIILLGRGEVAKVLERADLDTLARAMKAIPEKVRAFIEDCAPKAMRGELATRSEAIGRIRLHDVDEAQQAIVSLIREMEESGEILIERPGEAMA